MRVKGLKTEVKNEYSIGTRTMKKMGKTERTHSMRGETESKAEAFRKQKMGTLTRGIVTLKFGWWR